MTVMLQSRRGAGETVLVLHTASSAAYTAAYGVTIGTHTITGERGQSRNDHANVRIMGDLDD
jgi:hypothetical protein